MKDLKISYIQDGKEQNKEFDTLMDFMVHYELSDDKKQMTTATNITAVFFEKKILIKRFNTIHELYEHCRAITL